MKIQAYNSSTLGITSMIGDSIPISDIEIIVGSTRYNASGIDDRNDNGYWDPGETIYLNGLDLNHQSSVVVATHTQVLMSSNVKQSINPQPASPDTPNASTFTSYRPGLRMTTFNEPAFQNPVSANIADNITYASAASGFQSNDPVWPLSEAGKAHNFSVKFEGFLKIDNSTDYDLQIISTDAVSVFIDGNIVIGVAGSHGPSSWTGALNLSAGYHTLEIGYQDYSNEPMIGNFDIANHADGVWSQPEIFYIETTDA